MKTNRILTTTLCLLLCALVRLPIFGQMASEPNPMPNKPESSAYKAADEKKFYAKVYGFYGLLAPGGFRGQGVTPPTSSRTYTTTGYTQSTTATSDYSSKNAFGTGLRVGAGIGYVINDFINVGVDGEYLLVNVASESYVITSQRVSYVNLTRASATTTPYIASVTSEYPYSIVSIIPNITFKAVSKAEYYIYNRLGIIIGIPIQLDYTSSLLYKYPVGNPPVASTDFYEEKSTNEFEKGIGFGYQAALGVQFRISGGLRGFVEIVASNLQLKSDGYDVTKRQYRYKFGNENENGFDAKLEELPEDQRRKKGLNLNMPVSSIGLGAGLSLRF